MLLNDLLKEKLDPIFGISIFLLLPKKKVKIKCAKGCDPPLSQKKQKSSPFIKKEKLRIIFQICTTKPHHRHCVN